MNCIVDQGVAVETAEAGDGVVGVVADATVTKYQPLRTIDFDTFYFQNYCLFVVNELS